MAERKFKVLANSKPVNRENPLAAFSDEDRKRLTDPLIDSEGVHMMPKPEFMRAIEAHRVVNQAAIKARRALRRVP